MPDRIIIILQHFRIILICTVLCIQSVPQCVSAQTSWPAEAGTHTIRLKFGLQRATPAVWDGSITLTGGRVLWAEGWQFEEDDAIIASDRWKLSTRLSRFSDSRHQPWQRPALTPVKHLRSNGVDLHISAPSGRFSARVQTEQGTFSFESEGRHTGDRIQGLNGDAEVVFLPPTYRFGAEEDADDYPTVLIDSRGRRWIAWVAFRDDGDRILAATLDALDTPTVISGTHTDNFRTAMGEDDTGGIWVTWTAKQDGRWNIYGSRFAGAAWAKPQALTDGMGPDIFHKLCRDAEGRLWLAWQGHTKTDSDIFARYLHEGVWSEPVRISTSDANDWEPAITADSKGAVWFAWDTYEKGDYDIHVRQWKNGTLEPVRALTSAREMQVRPSIVCDSEDRLWVAWEEAGVNWGKDWSSMRFTYGGEGLYAGRRINTVIMDGENILEPAEQLEAAMQPEFSRYQQMPQLFDDKQGGMWMGFRVRAWHVANVRNNWGNPGSWQMMLSRYEGGRWSPPMALPLSNGRGDVRLSGSVSAEGSLLLCYAADGRLMTRQARPQSWQLTTARISIPSRAAPFLLQEYQEETIPYGRVHAQESVDVSRIQDYVYSVYNHTYRIYRGDLHRHTDISNDGIGDGSLLDLFRYARDCRCHGLCPRG